MLPVFLDEFVQTTEERSFIIMDELTGIIIRHQIGYPCNNEKNIYNSTSIVKLNSGDTITIYTPCRLNDFHKNDQVIIRPMKYDTTKGWTKREILVQFSKRSNNYPYYQCISCRYSNTIGEITLANKTINPMPSEHHFK